MLKTLHADDVHAMLEGDEDFVLINVLSEDAFQKEHIPGSHNLPQNQEDFASQVAELAGTKSRRIVVYCASETCQASPTAARKLEQAGFTNVFDFAGGMEEWTASGYEVASGAPTGNR